MTEMWLPNITLRDVLPITRYRPGLRRIGDWHTHLWDVREPSPQDLTSARLRAEDGDHARPTTR